MGIQINPRWLKLKEAAFYSKIGRDRLKKLAVEGKVKGFQDPDSGRGDWIFDRESIDDYIENQGGILRIKAAEIIKRAFGPSFLD
jgi:hypothetical protein